MDQKDKHILSELDKDSAINSSKIAKKLRLSRQTIDYRINKLISQGYIRSFTSFIDPLKLGFSSWKIYLQLTGTSQKIEKEMISFLEKHPKVWWAVKCYGSYDLLFSVFAEDFYEFNKMLSEFHEKFGQYIHKESINNHLEPVYFSRGWIVNKDPIKISKPFMKKPEKISVDDLDLKIMKLLGKNCRTPLTEIARKLNTTPRIINYRIQNLRKKELIVFNRLSLNPEKFNLEFYKGLIYLKNNDKKTMKKLEEYSRLNSNINECVKSVGPWQFEIELEVKGLSEFGKIVEDMKRHFQDNILRIEPLLLYEERKYEFNFLDYLSQ